MSRDCFKMSNIVSKSPQISLKLSQNELKIIRICEKCVFEKVWLSQGPGVTEPLGHAWLHSDLFKICWSCFYVIKSSETIQIDSVFFFRELKRPRGWENTLFLIKIDRMWTQKCNLKKVCPQDASYIPFQKHIFADSDNFLLILRQFVIIELICGDFETMLLIFRESWLNWDNFS